MGYFNNNTGDNNVFLCNIPVKKINKKKTMIQPLSHEASTGSLLALFSHAYVWNVHVHQTRVYVRRACTNTHTDS